MHQENNTNGEDPRAQETDERIRRSLAQAPLPDAPVAIQTRVFGRIRRRRLLLRAACAAIVIMLLGAAGLTSLWQSQRDPNTTRIARKVDALDAWLDTLDTSLLSGPPPVVALDLVARDQHALLDQLKSLNGVKK